MWQEAETASQMWRGGTTSLDMLPQYDAHPGLKAWPVPRGCSPGPARTSPRLGWPWSSVLDEAAADAPKDPGLFARTVRGFADGLGEGTTGIVTGVVRIVGLSTRLNPARALVDPHGHLDAVEAFGAGVATAATHPRDTLAASTDWQT